MAGNIEYIKDDGAGTNLVEYSSYTALGQPGTTLFPNPGGTQVQTDYTYYPETGRLKTVITRKGTDPPYQDLYYEYDGLGNTRVQDDNVTNILHTYDYDAFNRLAWAKGNDGTTYHEIYTYDVIGNIKSKTGVGTEYKYESTKPHAVTQIKDGETVKYRFDYDHNGNMVWKKEEATGTEWSMIYNYDNMPTSIQKGSTTVTFSYDGNGQRVKKVSPSHTVPVLYFGEAYETRDGVNTIHLFAGTKRVASIELGGLTKFYHTDHLGSTRIVTDSTGAPLEQIDYFPFGTYSSPSNPVTPYTFTGQEDDDELGFYNYKARLYDPLIGRFITPDSIVPHPEDPQSLNRYSYVRNNPMRYTDPTGNEDGEGGGDGTGEGGAGDYAAWGTYDDADGTSGMAAFGISTEDDGTGVMVAASTVPSGTKGTEGDKGTEGTGTKGPEGTKGTPEGQATPEGDKSESDDKGGQKPGQAFAFSSLWSAFKSIAKVVGWTKTGTTAENTGALIGSLAVGIPVGVVASQTGIPGAGLVAGSVAGWAGGKIGGALAGGRSSHGQSGMGPGVGTDGPGIEAGALGTAGGYYGIAFQK